MAAAARFGAAVGLTAAALLLRRAPASLDYVDGGYRTARLTCRVMNFDGIFVRAMLER